MGKDSGNIKKVIVVGGGAAGFFFAINVAINNPHYEVKILEQGKNTLGKVRISGGGRCNVTNGCFDPHDLIDYYPRGGKELLGPFHRFCTGDTMAWFEERGVPLKIENDNRVFPVSDSSSSITGCLEKEAIQNGIETIPSSKVVRIVFNKKGKVFCKNGKAYHFDVLFLATGSSKYIWNILKKKGLEIIDPVPSLFTFHVDDPRISELQGIAFENVEIKTEFNSYNSSGPLLITHWGFSAPSILKLSAFEARQMADSNYSFKIYIDLLPGYTVEELKSIGRQQGGKLLKDKNPYNIPRRYWDRLVKDILKYNSLRWADLKKDEMEVLVNELKNGCYFVNGKSTFKEEFVTSGGISLKEIDFKDFRIKKLENVYAAGEILDIDAVTGGFNFQGAWTGAYLAAMSA